MLTKRWVSFHDVTLRGSIDYAYQALALHELRRPFAPAIWTGAEEKADRGKTGQKEIIVEQVWFAGAHSDIGGGYPEKESGLSDISLEWMIERAEEQDLLFHTDNGLSRPDSFQSVHISREKQ